MATSFHKVACGAPEELGPLSGVDIFGATAAMVVPSRPDWLGEMAPAYVLVAGDVGAHGVALTEGMRWERFCSLDVAGGAWMLDLRPVVAFRLAHAPKEPVELVYSIRKGAA